MRRSPEFSGWRRVVGAGLAVGLGLVACGGGDRDDETREARSRDATTTTANAPEPFTVTFDYLDAGPRSVSVYPGVSESAFDMLAVGQYLDGDMLEAECWTEGRVVESRGDERSERSDIFVVVDSSPQLGSKSLAPGTYLEETDQELQAALDECETSELDQISGEWANR